MDNYDLVLEWTEAFDSVGKPLREIPTTQDELVRLLRDFIKDHDKVLVRAEQLEGELQMLKEEVIEALDRLDDRSDDLRRTVHSYSASNE